MFQINQPTRCNKFSSLLLDVYSYIQLNMFRESSRPSSRAQQLQEQPLVLPLERGGSSNRVTKIPDAVDTVVCAPDDGWRYHPKHVE